MVCYGFTFSEAKMIWTSLDGKYHSKLNSEDFNINWMDGNHWASNSLVIDYLQMVNEQSITNRWPRGIKRQPDGPLNLNVDLVFSSGGAQRLLVSKYFITACQVQGNISALKFLDPK